MRPQVLRANLRAPASGPHGGIRFSQAVEKALSYPVDGGLDLSRDRRYALERELGRGPRGVVFAGRDLFLDRAVAIKVMAARVGDDAGLRRQLEREIRAAARLSHRNVVAIHDFGCDGRGMPFIVMEPLRGRDLREALRGRRPLPLDRRLAVVLQVLAGLAHAHARGVVHGDLKPANVFITDDGVVKILDFGIARIIRAGGHGGDALKAEYITPEQVLGGPVDARSDLFSCGALLVELLTGRRPFHADGFVGIAHRVVNEPPDLGSLPASFRALEPVLGRALARSRDERYQSALDFATDIGLALGVGVAPETIQAAPAWTVPLPRLSPVRPPDPTVTARREWEENAMRPPDLSTMRPRWPLRAPHDEDEAPPRRTAGRLAGAALAVTAIAAAAALAAGTGRVDTAREPVATAAPASVALLPARTPQPPAPSRVAPAVTAAPAALASPPAVAAAPRADTRHGGGSFWTFVAPRTAARPKPQPARLTEVAGRWTGHLTRRGTTPVIAIDGRLYAVVRADRILGRGDRRVTVVGRLDATRGVLTVSEGWPAR